MASGFDGLSGVLSAGVMARMNADMEHAAVTLLEPHDGERFVVVGFGPGVGLVALLDTVEPKSVLAVDPSGAMVRAATRRLGRHPRSPCVELRHITSAAIPASADGDAAVAVNCVQLWDPHIDSARAVSGALRLGGRFVSLTHEWAIAKRGTVESWKESVTADLTAVGFSEPRWTNATYRSGRALGMRAVKTT